jgi:hypothetical protein
MLRAKSRYRSLVVFKEYLPLSTWGAPDMGKLAVHRGIVPPHFEDLVRFGSEIDS